MKWLLPVVVAAAVFSAAAATAPDGFRESARLTPIARALSIPEARVYCALTAASWRDANPGNASWDTTDGKTVYAENAMYLAPWTCQPLELWKRGKVAPPADVGRALLTVGHEAVHLRRVYDERTAECTALSELRSVARTHFGIKAAKTWRQVWAGALASHAQALPEQRNC